MERVFKRDGILFKILPCLLITMYAFMVLYGSFVYATDETGTFTYNDVDYPLPDFSSLFPDQSEYCQYFIICQRYNEPTGFFCYSSRSPFYSTVTSGGSVGFHTNSESVKVCSFSISRGTWNVSSTQYNNPSGDIGFNASYFNANHENNYYYCNHDIYDYDNNELLVFQAPPQEQIQATSLVIAPQVEGVQMNKVLQEILGILPVILLVIVGLLAIRKGIQMIVTFLQKS